MDGKGWKPEYGISLEGVEILGFVEALPRDVRRQLADAVREVCRREGYLSLYDDVRALLARERAQRRSEKLAKVIPLFRRG